MAPEKDEEFNEWYNKKHIPEVLRAPGFISGKRYRATRGSPKYWAVYEAESEEALKAALGSPEFKIAADDFQQNWEPYASNLSMVRGVQIGP
jgi:predicted HD phosphohydrolase